jgi:hypothetical protein
VTVAESYEETFVRGADVAEISAREAAVRTESRKRSCRAILHAMMQGEQGDLLDHDGEDEHDEWENHFLVDCEEHPTFHLADHLFCRGACLHWKTLSSFR